METPEEFLEQLNIDPKKFVTVRQELGASSGSAYMLKDLLEDYAKLKNHGDIGDVISSLPRYDVEDLNEIIQELKDGKQTLFEALANIWNTAYNEGIRDERC